MKRPDRTYHPFRRRNRMLEITDLLDSADQETGHTGQVGGDREDDRPWCKIILDRE